MLRSCDPKLRYLVVLALLGGCGREGKDLAQDTACVACGEDSKTPEEPCPDTAWLEELPVEPCPDPVEGAVVDQTEMFSVALFYYAGVIDPTGYYVQLDGFTYSDDGEGADNCGYGATQDITEGLVVGEYLYDLYLSIPLLDDPIEYQGVYTYDEDAETWGDEPALRFLIGWYDASDGYLHVHNFMASDSGVCLSRVRPGRLSGALWWTPSERYAEDYDPLYITFDLRDPLEGERDCLHTRYDSGLTEEAIWPELDCPDDTLTP